MTPPRPDESPGNRHGGEFQINTIAPGSATTTLATCEMTLVAGHSYRLVFKCVGQLYTGQIYDLDDLTTPLATIQVNDRLDVHVGHHAVFFLTAATARRALRMSRSTITTRGPSDPNLATPPALMPPISGTPMVETRTPAERWQNFYNPASGISFTAKTYTTDVINSAATKLLLNGVDFSSQLTLSPNGTVFTGSLPGSVLKANSFTAPRSPWQTPPA